VWFCRDEVRMDTGEPFVPFLNWNLCKGLHEIMSTCLEKCFKEFTEHYFDKVFNDDRCLLQFTTAHYDTYIL